MQSKYNVDPEMRHKHGTSSKAGIFLPNARKTKLLQGSMLTITTAANVVASEATVTESGERALRLKEAATQITDAGNTEVVVTIVCLNACGQPNTNLLLKTLAFATQEFRVQGLAGSSLGKRHGRQMRVKS